MEFMVNNVTVFYCPYL